MHLYTCRNPHLSLLWGSNVGELANAAGVKFTVEGRGRFFCPAGIGGQVSSLVESAKAAKRVMGIDGCKVACSKSTLEQGIEKYNKYRIDPYAPTKRSTIRRT